MPRADRTQGPRRDPMLSGGISAGCVRLFDEDEDSAHRSSLNGIVQSVSLNRSAAGITDQLLDARTRHAEAGWRARTMNDAFFDDRAVEIVGSKPKRDLRQRRRQRHPIGLD